MAVASLVFDLIARDAASPAFNRVAASADRAAVATGRAEKSIGSSATGISKSMKLMGAGIAAFAVGDVFVHAISDATQYNAVLNKVATNTGLTTAKMNQFSKSFMSISNQSAQPVADIATGFGELYAALTKLGDKPKQILDVLSASAKAATASGTDLGTELNAVVSEMTAFKTPASQVNTVLGQMIATVGQGNMNMQDLSESLAGLPAYAAAAGVQMKDVNAMLAEFGDMGIKGAAAGTKVRMVIQDLIQPSAHADAALKTIGLTTQDLFNTLKNQGGVATIKLLADHFKDAGIQGTALEKVLLETFTKKGGAGIAQMVTHADQLTETITRVTGGVATLGRSEQQTFSSASVVFKRFGNEVSNAFIMLGEKILPVVTSAAQWLGTNLPKAIHTLSDILEPTIHMIGTGLAMAWHAALDVLKPVGSALASIGHFLANNAQAVKYVVGPILAMWAAWKGYLIVSTAARAISAGFSALAMRAEITALRVRGAAMASTSFFSTYGKGLGILGAVTGGFYALGKGIDSAIHSGDSMRQLGDITALIGQWRDELVATNGALTESIRLEGEKKLQDSGLADKAAAAGISLRDLTDGMFGNDRQMAALIGRWQQFGDPADSTILAFQVLHRSFGLSTADANKIIAANTKAGKSFDGYGSAASRAAEAMGRNVSAQRNATGPLSQVNVEWLKQQQQADGTAKSIEKLTAKLQANISAALTAKDAELGFRAGLLSLKQQVDTNGKSLSDNTAKGVANQQMLVGLAQSAADAAQNTADASHGSISYTQALKSNIQELIAHAHGADLSTASVKKLLGSLGLLPSQIGTKVTADTSSATANLQHVMDVLKHLQDGTYSFTVDGIVQTIVRAGNTSQPQPQKKAGGGSIRGAGTSTSDSIPIMASDGEYMVRASRAARHRQLLDAINFAPGFAGGGHVDVGAIKSWIHAQNPKRYDWGAVGPDAYDCSGLVGDVVQRVAGSNAYGRIFSTSNEAAVLPGYGFQPGPGTGEGNLIVGWNSHHTTGRLAGLNFEAYGDNGVALDRQVRVGPSAFDPRKFPNVMHLAVGSSNKEGPPGGDPPSSGGGNNKGPTKKQQRHTQHVQALRQARYDFESSQHPHKILMRHGHAYFGGQEYDTRALAEEAKREAQVTSAQNKAQAQRQAQRQALQSLRSGVGAFIGALGGSVGAERKAFRGLLPDIRKLGGDDKFISRIEEQNKRLDNAMHHRNKIEKALEKAKAALARTIQARNSLESSVRSSIGFDITSAGTNATNSGVSAGAMLAQEKQQLTLIKKWSAGIVKLHKMGLSGPMLSQLASAGPTSWPQVNALLHASPKVFREIMRDQRRINAAAKDIANRVGKDVYGGKVHDEKQRRDRERRRERHAEHRVERLAKKIGDEIGKEFKHLKIEVVIDKKGMARVVRDGEKQAKRDGHHQK